MIPTLWMDTLNHTAAADRYQWRKCHPICSGSKSKPNSTGYQPPSRYPVHLNLLSFYGI